MDSSNWMAASLDLNANPLRLFDDTPVRENISLVGVDGVVGMITYVLDLGFLFFFFFFWLQKKEVQDDFTGLGLKVVSLKEEEVSLWRTLNLEYICSS